MNQRRAQRKATRSGATMIVAEAIIGPYQKVVAQAKECAVQ